MPTHQLRELEDDGLIVRTIHPEVPPRFEYSLAPRGRSLQPVLMALSAWAELRSYHKFLFVLAGRGAKLSAD